MTAVVLSANGRWRIVCEDCDTQTAEWEREVADRLAATHQCPGRWERGAGG